MLTKSQLELLKKSNKTLAILGLFRSGDDQVRYIFNNNSGKDGKVSVADLFAKLKPELRSSSKGILEIGDTIFNKYELSTPADGENRGNSQPILFDSPLLDGTIYSGEEAKSMQEQGKKVVESLLESLDTVAYFTDTHFTKSLMKIAKHYLLEEANENLEHKIADDAQWYKTIYSDNAFCSKIVRYLTAHEQDESEIETSIQRHLNSFENDSGKKTYNAEQVESIAQALVKCKRVMLDGTQEDVTWNKIAQTSQFSWLKNYASDPDYGLVHSPIQSKVGDKSFLAYYSTFMNASDQIHRLIRTQAIHSSVFCWLASKYKKWDLTSRAEAGREMFRIGVEEQGEQRIRSESREAYIRNNELIQKAEVDPALAERVEGDSNYRTFAEKAEDNIFDALLPDRAVTPKALRLRAKKIFKRLNQTAGGKAGQILKENEEFNQLFVKYYRSILNTQDDATIKDFDARLNKEALKDKENELFSKFDIKEFIKNVISQVDVQKASVQEADVQKAEETLGTEAATEDLKIKVKESFIGEFAKVSKNRFAEEYLKNQDQIKDEEQLAQDLYDLRSIQEVSSTDEAAGAPVYVMTDLAMPDFESVDEDIKTARKQKIQQAAQTAISENLTLSVTAPKLDVFKSIDTGVTGSVTNGDGKSIGQYTVQENNIKLSANEAEVADEFNSEEAQVDIEGKTYKLQELDIPEIMDFPKPDEIKAASRLTEAAKTSYSHLSKSMDTILDKYSDGMSEEFGFNRAFRALLLCEYIQSAPKGATQLGREDLSNILGLMVDIVEHLGDVDDSKILDGVLSEDPRLLKLLQKINLSKYYPAEKESEISTILQYQYELCKKLSDVKSYLQELAEMKNFFNRMRRTDLEVVVINSTVADYGNYNDVDYGEFCFNIDCPSVVYLTSQSQASADSLTTMASTLAKLARDTNASNLQIPVFVSSQSLPASNIPLPLICATEALDLSDLSFHADGLSGNGTLDITVDWEEGQNNYLLLSAAPMLPDSSSALGAIAKFKPVVSRKMRDTFGVQIENNQAVADLFRQFWLSKTCQLLDTFVFTKWLNVLLLESRAESGVDISQNFGLILDEKLWKPKESPEVCEAAFSTVKALSLIPIIAEKNGQFGSPSSLGGGSYAMTEKFGTDLDDSPRYMFDIPWKDLFAKELEA